MEEQLLIRSENKCELCGSAGSLKLFEVLPHAGRTEDNCVMICDKCLAQVEKTEEPDLKHLNCLRTSIWSAVPGVQVITWRLLNRLKDENWAADSLDMMYLDEDTLAWAQAGLDEESNTANEVHKDCNGQLLETGNSVVLTKTLDVKGSSLSAKLGTVVKNIRLVENNTDQIEGKIEGQTIVILTRYVRKQS
ncbi:PhnA domain-containing protein [Pedobacter heparinus]|uniref:PhnA protein n=1 Tax=Pedobacter heparinus (strain ATCC 13125 / DSM 2366 / CIP 104194 / JCM 7457 / NBRC 12017 / NCIMB 9290 / NRRL B-14731 / HIM 762-3) TaxID=485917 RepID=C6XX38_PEDHD|nr:alkylphosphonate utilization protein [Pedobacter heparinus]ACU04332.1 PhnA protein [Pedobacter heparinus DSM 2366]